MTEERDWSLPTVTALLTSRFQDRLEFVWTGEEWERSVRRTDMHRHGQAGWLGIVTGMLLCVGLASPVSAQVTTGLRAGLSLDPDQFFFGGHIETAPLTDRVYFRPNIEVGVGDGTLVALNFEFVYKFPARQQWQFYAGAGPALNIVSNGDSDTEGGFNILIGAEQSSGLLFEFKVGAAGGPDVKFAVGYTFR
jgi:hypothetical protein